MPGARPCRQWQPGGTASEVERLAELLDTHMLLAHLNGGTWYEVHPLARRSAWPDMTAGAVAGTTEAAWQPLWSRLALRDDFWLAGLSNGPARRWRRPRAASCGAANPTTSTRPCPS